MAANSPNVRASVVAVTNIVVGATAALAAARTADAVGSADGRPHPAIVRVLGLRQLAQGVITLAVPTRDVLRLGAAVDTAHALSMAPLLLTRFRRAAAISAAAAAVSASASAAAARR